VATFPYTGFPDGQTYPVIPLGSSVVNVSSSSALTTALSNATAGQKIVLANGTYSGSFQVSGKNGSSSSGISVEAASTGGAVFAAGSSFTVKDSSYVTLRGLSFPFELSSGNLTQFRGSAHHCRITRCLFGPSSVGSPGSNKSPFVYLGDNCDFIRIDHNELRNKANPGNAILGDGNFSSFQVVKHIRIDHNYIHDIRPEVDNEKEPIRLGVSTMSKTMSYSVIERNRFQGCICEPEIVSAKAGGIRISGNVFYRSIGGPVYRHGVSGVMSDNYVVDGAQTFGSTIGSGGFRFYDKEHEVSYNYVQGVFGGNFQGALLLDTGDAEGSSTNLSAHWRVVNALVERNVLVGNPTGIQIGDNYSSAPTGCNIRDNIVAQAGNGQAITQLVAPVSTAQNNNPYYATPAAGGLAQDSASVWRKSGYGPRLTFLQAGDVGVSGDLSDSDGTGALVGGGGPGPDPEPPPTGDIFVSTAGSDSNAGSSWATAKRTLAAGVSAASAGSTVLVGSGTYSGNFVTTKGGSSSGGYITIRSEVKHGAVITGVRTGDESAVKIDHQYIRLQDFTITSASSGSSSIRNGVVINANNVQVVGNHIHTTCQFLTEGTSWQGGAGVDVWGGAKTNVLIEANLIHNIGLSSSTQQLVHGIYLAQPATNGRVVNNIVYECEDYGIHPYPQEEATGWVLANNTVAATARGIRTGNNTVVRNNISYDNDTINFDVRGSGSVLSNNLSDSGSMSGVTVANPLFVDYAGRDFRLQDSSPARNAGTSTNAPGSDIAGTQRPQGSAVDIGAYEMLAVDAPPPTDTATAAGKFGWGQPLALSDEFNYTGAPDPTRWKLPGADWAGHNENGTRDPERMVVEDGRLIMTGLANGSTGWMQHKLDQQYGRWEVRCRSYATASSNGNDYHPVLLIWPTSNSRQTDGEYDYLENGAPGEQEAGAFLHYPHPGTSVVQQEHFEKSGVDLTQWHNFALEWTPDHLKLFCDGVLWGTASGGANSVRRNIQDMPSGHGTIQLDNFDGTSQTPAKFEVEWYRVYTLVPSGPPASAQTVSPFGISSGQAFGRPTISGAEPEPPPGSHATLLGSADTILPFSLGFTVGDGTDPPPAGSQTVTPSGIPSAQAFGLPLLSVADGPQDVRAIGIPSAAVFGAPTVAAGPPPPAAPGGVLVPSVYAVDQTGKLTPLSAWTKLKVSPVRNSMGAIQLEYPAGAPGFSTLHGNVSAHPLRALEIRVWLGGSQEGALGGWLVQKAGDDLVPGDAWTFTGHFHEWLLSKAIIGPQERTEENEKGELRFAGATAGLVFTTVMDQAQARGALPLVTRDFSTTHDSNGNPWPTTVSSFALAPKTTLLQVADKLVELGMVEYELTAARVWRAYAPGTMGEDRTTGLTPLTFAHALNLAEHSRRESAKDAATAVLAAGSEGFYAWAESATAVAELGWRAEVGADAGQLSSATAVQAFAATQLEAVRNGVAEFVGSVEFATGVSLPIVNWGLGDWAYTWVNNERRRLRIAQVDLEFAQGVPPRGTVALNDLITDKVSALYKRLNAIAAGDAVVGTSVPTPGGSGEDRIPPAAPTGLTLSSTIAFRVPGQAASLALVSAGWAAVLNDAYADAATASKAQAATMVAARMADAIVVGRIATDDATAGQVQAAEEIAQRLSSALADQPNSTIFEDWTWQGAPAIVVQHHDALLTEFFAAGFAGDDITLSEQALEWLRDYEGPTSYLYESWTWDGAPDIVHTYAPILKEEFEREHPDQNLPDFPEQVAVIAQAWLAGYALTHQGGGAVSGDVDHYRVNYTYLGGQPLTPQQQYEIDQGLLEDTTWVEPEGSPTRSTSLTFGDIEGGRSLGVRVCAVDRADNQGPWSPTVAVDTAVDDQPPPRPSRPIASVWYRTMDIRWDGLGSSGEDMLAAAPDFASGGGLEVHVAEGIDFLPHRPVVDGKVDLSQSTTYKTTLYAAGITNVLNLTIGHTYFARFVAVDRNGNASGPSETSAGIQPQQLVSIDYGPGTIEGIHIKEAAIGRAQIANAAIGSAQIEEVSAGLLTAGTMTAQVTLSGRFSTPEINGNKLEFDNAGIRLFRGGTVVGRWQVSDATMLVTGTYLTGLSGERIELHQNGTQRFYGTAGVDFAEIANDGGVLRFRSRPDAFGRRSWVDFDPTAFRVRYGTTTESRSRLDIGLTYSVLNAPVTGIRVLSQYIPDDATENRFHFVIADANGDINNSTIHYRANPFKGGNPSFLASGFSPDGSGISFFNGGIDFTKGNGNAYVPIYHGGQFNNSTEMVKREIGPIRHAKGYHSLDVVARVRAYGYVYDWDLDPIEPRTVTVERRHPDGSMRMVHEQLDSARRRPPLRQFGPLAEHLMAVSPDLVHRDRDGHLMTSDGGKVAVLWEAVAELYAMVRELRGDAERIVVESSVQDPTRWLELPGTAENGDK
jgi:chondroitinase B-like protein/glycosyl hydrolase family 16